MSGRLGFGARSTTRSTRVSVPRTSVSWVTRVRASETGVRRPRRSVWGAWTALRVSPLPRFCMLRGIAACCGRARRAGTLLTLLTLLRAAAFAFAIRDSGDLFEDALRESYSLPLFDSVEHPLDFDHQIVRQTRL